MALTCGGALGPTRPQLVEQDNRPEDGDLYFIVWGTRMPTVWICELQGVGEGVSLLYPVSTERSRFRQSRSMWQPSICCTDIVSSGPSIFLFSTLEPEQYKWFTYYPE